MLAKLQIELTINKVDINKTSKSEAESTFHARVKASLKSATLVGCVCPPSIIVGTALVFECDYRARVT